MQSVKSAALEGAKQGATAVHVEVTQFPVHVADPAELKYTMLELGPMAFVAVNKSAHIAVISKIRDIFVRQGKADPISASNEGRLRAKDWEMVVSIERGARDSW